MSKKQRGFHFLFNEDVAIHDPLMADLIRLETERQARQIVLIPSESICALPVRRVLDSPFTNLYAEGYPPSINTFKNLDGLSDLPAQLAHYRRYADRRFYKGNAYVNIVESLCRRRAAEAFATDRAPAADIFANVQALSGAAANLAVYEAFLHLGDTLMAMDLMQGGHLSHGSEFHMSGKRYRIVPYGIDPRSGKLDYEAIHELALREKPRLIVAGFTSYPWAPDWEKFRAIADDCGALLMADIAHTAGMAAAGAYPNPVGLADVVTFTTHKTLMGPRGAVILTTDEEKARAIDNAVFPGEQGGPHLNNIAALAVALHLAQTDEFKALQRRIVDNAKLLAEELTRLGLRLCYGGTDTHLLLIDLKHPKHPNGGVVYGEMAARLLELCGIIANKNTIPGDTATAMATGLRLGTPWITQRGAGPDQIKELARLLHQVIGSIQPFKYEGVTAELPRGKIDPRILDQVSRDAAALAATLTQDPPQTSGYPHFPQLERAAAGSLLVRLSGERVEAHLQNQVTADLKALAPGRALTTFLLDIEGKVRDEVAVARVPDAAPPAFVLRGHAEAADRLLLWLRGHADGYLLFEPDDITAKVEGPVIVEQLAPNAPEVALLAEAPPTAAANLGVAATDLFKKQPEAFALHKPYFIGQNRLARLVEPLTDRKEFAWKEKEGELLRTPLNDEHRRLGARLVPFAGWEMPVRYQSTIEEHNTVRRAAGLFDVGHMGVLEISGEHAEDFIDLVTTNYARWFEVGKSFYSYLLDPDAQVIDDIMVYHLAPRRFLVVVNAANEEKDWAWLNLVNSGRALIDRGITQRRRLGEATLKKLHDPQWGDACRIDLALQGPASRDILLRLAKGEAMRTLRRLLRTECAEMELAGLPVVVSRTGYTGESIAYEIFVHPDQSAALWRAILEEGRDLGVKPVGLGARDSLRIEAGLPLYGHELAGPYDVLPGSCGFAGYVKFHKPFFIGKQAYLKRDSRRERLIVRFRAPQKGTKPLKTGDPLTDVRGNFAGNITSCAVDGEGLQIGLAFVLAKYVAAERLLAYPLPADREQEAKPLAMLDKGDRLSVPIDLELLSRFPERDLPARQK